jgi:hypothetical protein
MSRGVKALYEEVIGRAYMQLFFNFRQLLKWQGIWNKKGFITKCIVKFIQIEAYLASIIEFKGAGKTYNMWKSRAN